MLMTTRFALSTFPLAYVLLAAAVVSGQDFPNKPIRIMTSEAGGNADFMTRLIAQGISGPMGQPVIVDNRPTALVPEVVTKAPPDGYTLILLGNSFWIAPLLRNTSYDPVRDFSPITLVSSSPNIIVVHPSLPVKSIKELIALAKARPGQLNYAVASMGSSPHLAAELFKAMAGVNIVLIPYRGITQATTSLMAGEVQLMIPSAGTVMPHVKAGRLRPLAVTSEKPSTLVPGLATVAASGLPGYESVTNNGMFARAKTPATIINRLSEEIARYLHNADVKEKFLNVGVEPAGSPPEQLAATIKSEMTRLGKVIKDVGIKAE